MLYHQWYNLHFTPKWCNILHHFCVKCKLHHQKLYHWITVYAKIFEKVLYGSSRILSLEGYQPGLNRYRYFGNCRAYRNFGTITFFPFLIFPSFTLTFSPYYFFTLKFVQIGKKSKRENKGEKLIVLKFRYR
jgi:hypothetical protein